MNSDVVTSERLLEQAIRGDRSSWGAVLAAHASRLNRLVAARLDRRLQGRIDADDVLQEICLEAWRSLPNYTSQSQPFYLWLRGVAGNKLLEVHRRHLGTQKRDARREQQGLGGASPDSTSVLLVSLILDSATSASAVARREELKSRLHESLEQMDALDREVLVLRHFEQLTPAETAAVLGIKEKAAGMRYLRAVKRLGSILNQLPGGLEALRP